MKQVLKILAIFLVIDAVIIAAYIAYKSFSGGGESKEASAYEWATIDENFQPRDFIEEYIKNEASQKGLFPVYMRDFDKDESVLRNFIGSRFANPNVASLRMAYPGMEDWKLIDIKYKDEQEREIRRTILYIFIEGAWKVGDSGQLPQK